MGISARACAGTAYGDRSHVQPAQARRSALKSASSRPSSRPAPPEDWIGVSVPAIIAQERFAAQDWDEIFRKRRLPSISLCGGCHPAFSGVGARQSGHLFHDACEPPRLFADYRQRLTVFARLPL